jgi:hypothetical protein
MPLSASAATFGVTHAKGSAVIVAKGEFRQIAMKVGFAAVLIDAVHSTTEH